ncbi:MAG: hypothetical protein P4N59_25660 [Negativicutes bacterium]|nr:hypothetical protein [Negativicutes bacterium]
MANLSLTALLRLQEASSGDMAFAISPPTKSTVHGSAGNRTVRIQLTNAAGQVHEWFTGQITLAVAKSSSAGTVALPGGTTPTMTGGTYDCVITEGGTWAAADTNTLTLSALTIMGKSVTGGTSVETMT